MYNLICNTALVLWCISLMFLLLDLITSWVVQPPILNGMGTSLIVLGIYAICAIKWSKK